MGSSPNSSAWPASRRPTRSCTPRRVSELRRGGRRIVEDAIAGVEAGRAGAFGLVVAIERAAAATALTRAGADVVVSDLAQTLPASEPSPETGVTD